MRKITQIPNTNQDEIKAMYHNFYSKVRYKNLKVLIKGVNDDFNFTSNKQSEVIASYGNDRLSKTADKSNILIKGVNDDISITTKTINNKGITKRSTITLSRKDFHSEIIKMSKNDNFKFSWEFN